jgi:hypothetical protein
MLAGLCITAVLALQTRSFAQSGELHTLIESGLERYKRQDYEGARGIFARAYEVAPEIGILFNLALAELHSGHPVDAAIHLRTFIASTQAAPERRESARLKWLPEAEAQVGQLSITAPPGTAVAVDGAAIGVAPFEQPVYITPGDHGVTAKSGSGERYRRISVDAGHVAAVRFEPELAPPPPPQPEAPPAPTKPALPERAPSPPATTPSVGKIVTVGGIGVAAALAATAGVALALDTQRKRDQYESASCDKPPQASSASCGGLAQSGQNEGVLANVLYVGAGVLAGGAIATLFLWPNTPTTKSWMLRPTFDHRSAAAFLVGSF